MKACMLAYTFYETDNRVMRYAEELVRQGWTVEAIALRREGQAKTENINGVEVLRIQTRRIDEKGRLSYLKRIAEFLFRSSWVVSRRHMRERYDLIHVHSVPDFEVFAALFPKLMGAKVILDIHDIVPEFYSAKFNTSKNSPLFKALVLAERISAGFADHVIISNHIWEKKVIERSVPPEKCTTIMNYPSDLWQKEYRRTRNDDRFVLVYPGSLNWHQGLDIAIDAMNIIKEEIPKAELHIVGEGPAKADLISQARRSGLEDKVKFMDPVPITEVPHIMVNADIGIIPKRNDEFGGEAFSTKTLEFMSVGVPIIVSRTTIDNYYFNDEVVRFFEPGNPESLAEAISELCCHPDQRMKQTEKASDFVAKFSWKSNRRIYLDMVDRLIEN